MLKYNYVGQKDGQIIRQMDRADALLFYAINAVSGNKLGCEYSRSVKDSSNYGWSWIWPNL